MEAEVKEWEKKDPIPRFRAYLNRKGLWDETFEKAVQEKAADDVEKAVAAAESVPPPSHEDIFSYAYKQMTPQLNAQLEELKRFLKEGLK
jgi:pyruvate dehydrogenase E1 component subunit alpha